MPPRLRRILVRIQGALRGAYSLSVSLNATPNTGQKTSKMGALFLATSLKQGDKILRYKQFGQALITNRPFLENIW